MLSVFMLNVVMLSVVYSLVNLTMMLHLALTTKVGQNYFKDFDNIKCSNLLPNFSSPDYFDKARP